eukprot:5193957-Pyramimonas_sp.AAC.1
MEPIGELGPHEWGDDGRRLEISACLSRGADDHSPHPKDEEEEEEEEDDSGFRIQRHWERVIHTSSDLCKNSYIRRST